MPINRAKHLTNAVEFINELNSLLRLGVKIVSIYETDRELSVDYSMSRGRGHKPVYGVSVLIHPKNKCVIKKSWVDAKKKGLLLELSLKSQQLQKDFSVFLPYKAS